MMWSLKYLPSLHFSWARFWLNPTVWWFCHHPNISGLDHHDLSVQRTSFHYTLVLNHDWNWSILVRNLFSQHQHFLEALKWRTVSSKRPVPVSAAEARPPQGLSLWDHSVPAFDQWDQSIPVNTAGRRLEPFQNCKLLLLKPGITRVTTYQIIALICHW